MMQAITAFLLANTLFFAVACAETYTWTDSKGTIHFSEDPGTVPKELRNSVRKLDDIEPSLPDRKVSTPKEVQADTGSDAAPKVPPADDFYDGRSYEQWQQELADSEAALIAVRRRLDELAEQLKYARAKSYEQQSLFAEYNPLLEKFKAMKTEYYQLVAAARKAGLTVNIQEQ